MELLCPAVGTAGHAASHSACRYWGSSEKQASIFHTQALKLRLSPLLSLKRISYDKWPIDKAMTFYFFCSKRWSIDVAAVCCQRFDSLWILQKLNHPEVISILLKLHLNLPWNSCSMLPRAQPFLTIRVFSYKKEKCLKALRSFLALISAISLHVHNSTFLGTGSGRAAHCHRDLRESRELSWRAIHYHGFWFWHWLDETFLASMKEHHQLLTHFSAPGTLLGEQIPCLLSSNLLLKHLRKQECIVFLEIVENRHR